MSRQSILLAVGLTLLLSLTLAWFFLTSPWLTWQLLPDAPIKVVVDTSEGAAKILADSLLAGASEVSVHQGSALDRLKYVALKLNPFNFAPGVTQWPSLGAVAWANLRQAGHRMIFERVPLYPDVIAAAEPNAIFASEPLTLIGKSHQGKVRFRVAASLAADTRNPWRPRAEPSAGVTLDITVPGNLFLALPMSLRVGWNDLLWRRLHLTAIRPDIASYISQFKTVHINLTSAEVTLGVRGAPDAFTETIKTWWQDNERNGRPTQRSFRLPDGTLGRELVPGEPRPLFMPVDSSCQADGEAEDDFWLCQKGNQAILSSAEAKARLTDIASTDTWRVAVAPRQIQNEGSINICEANGPVSVPLWCRFSGLTLEGGGGIAAGAVTIAD